MLKKLYIFLLVFFGLITPAIYAQPMNHAAEDPTDFMNSNGKIFVVMAVAVVIVLGLFIYLINLDRKISKLEKGNIDKS